jgi:hypothetical protein
MPDAQGRLTVADVAAEFGIEPSDWRARVSRGHAPKPDGYDVIDGAPRAFYLPATIEPYRRARAERTRPSQ